MYVRLLFIMIDRQNDLGTGIEDEKGKDVFSVELRFATGIANQISQTVRPAYGI